MRFRGAFSPSLLSLVALATGCAAAAPAATPKPSEIVLAAPADPSSHPPSLEGPLLEGVCFVSVSEASGFVLPHTEHDGTELRGLDLHAIEACYAGYVQAHPRSVPGLPGWARFAAKSAPGERVETSARDDSGLPPALRTCLLTALARTTWTPGPTIKEIYISFR